MNYVPADAAPAAPKLQEWVVRSNEDAKQFLQLIAKYSPEGASSLGVDGWGSAAVTRQFMTSVGFPWQGNAAPTEFVLEVEEKLF